MSIYPSNDSIVRVGHHEAEDEFADGWVGVGRREKVAETVHAFGLQERVERVAMGHEPPKSEGTCHLTGVIEGTEPDVELLGRRACVCLARAA